MLLLVDLWPEICINIKDITEMSFEIHLTKVVVYQFIIIIIIIFFLVFFFVCQFDASFPSSFGAFSTSLILWPMNKAGEHQKTYTSHSYLCDVK